MRLSTCALLAFSAGSLLAAGPTQPESFAIWPGVPPGDEAFRPPPPRPPRSDGIIRVPLVTEPRLTVFHPSRDRANGTVVVVCPGGGYNILAWDLEGTEVAEWLNTLGVTAAVLAYRVPRRSPAEPHAAPLQDVQRALRQVRHHAASWGVDPDRVGVLGFSAAGHATVLAATQWAALSYPRQDAIDDLGCRPDFAIPIYPAYLGDEVTPGPLDPLIRVTAETPPMFVVVTHDDRLRGMNAALLYAELKRSKVPAELHIFRRVATVTVCGLRKTRSRAGPRSVRIG
jgi:acetyl esterase/lipase